MQRVAVGQRRKLRGYSVGRQAYDRRRRREPLDQEGRDFKAIVQHDPCGLCGWHEGLADADHIDGLSDGGANIWSNLAGLCPSCNRSKGSRRLLETMLNG